MQVPNDWLETIAAFRAGATLSREYEALFGPLRSGAVDDLVIVGQLGQSIDGRIATPSGHSHYINGDDGLVHLHRLRALMDAVVIGVGTALADDPKLTVRRVEGSNPARVVIDARGRLPASARLFADDGTRRLVIGSQSRADLPAGVEQVVIMAPDGSFRPEAVVTELAQRGFRRILIEGGADTVSRFIAAGCLDRLHVAVAPVLLGAGFSGLNLPPVERADQALRPPVQIHQIGREVLFDCDLTAQRVVLGAAKKSI